MHSALLNPATPPGWGAAAAVNVSDLRVSAGRKMQMECFFMLETMQMSLTAELS